MNKQKGFTLIELIMVIVILGILSAFALPRFANLSDQAQSSTNQGLFGAIRSASGIGHATFLAEGDSITLEGQAYSEVNGYIAADAEAGTPWGIIDAAQINVNDTNGITLTAAVGAVPAFTTITLPEGNGTCTITYSEATATASPDITTTCN